jgi:hypothetical protein
LGSWESSERWSHVLERSVNFGFVNWNHKPVKAALASNCSFRIMNQISTLCTGPSQWAACEGSAAVLCRSSSGHGRPSLEPSR